MLSPYRVVDATDHRGQLAGLRARRSRRRRRPRRAARRQPGSPPWRRARVVVVQPGQVERRVRRRTTTCSPSPATPTCSSTAARRATTTPSWRPSTPVSCTSRSARSASTDRRPTGRRPISPCSPPAAPRRSTATPTARRCAPPSPRRGCTPAARPPSARCSRCTERERSGLGQHVDVSAQQAVMQAGIPGVLLAPNANPEARPHRRRHPPRRPAPAVRLPGARRLRVDHPAVRLDDRPVLQAADGVGARGGPLRRGDGRLGLGRRSASACWPRPKAPASWSRSRPRSPS